MVELDSWHPLSQEEETETERGREQGQEGVRYTLVGPLPLPFLNMRVGLWRKIDFVLATRSSRPTLQNTKGVSLVMLKAFTPSLTGPSAGRSGSFCESLAYAAEIISH